MPDHELVFVYGTLRRGGSRAVPDLFPDAKFVGFGSVQGRLYDFGAYPGFIPSADADSIAVVGEVYCVSQQALRCMDEIEAWHEHNPAGSYYWRRRHLIRLRHGACCEAWVYECNPHRFDLSAPISSGDWIAHAQLKGALPEERWPDGTPLAR